MRRDSAIPFLAFLVVLAMALVFSAPCQARSQNDEVAKLVKNGLAAFEGGDVQGAIAAYSRALEIDPRHPEARYERAMSYHAVGDYTSCLSDAEAGLSLQSPLEARFFGIAGSCLSADGKTKKALRQFRRGIKRFPEDVPLNLNIAVTLANTGELDEARSRLKTVLHQEPNHPTANLYLATLFQRGGYRVPAAFQYLRFLAVEASTQRSASAALGFLEVLSIGLEQTGEKQFNLTLFTAEPMDEGDFGPLSTGLSLLAAVATTEKYQVLQPAPRLSRIVDSLVDLARERKETEMRETFVWKHAIDFLIEMKEDSVLEAFSYAAFSPLRLDGGREWLDSHPEDLARLREWLGSAPSEGRAK